MTFDDLFKQSDWLLRLPLVCFIYFRVSLLLSVKKNLTFFQLLFIFSHIQNLTNFDIDSYIMHIWTSKVHVQKKAHRNIAAISGLSFI